MLARLHKVLSWVQEHERHLSAPIFIAGFLNDVFFTYGRLALADAMVVFGTYVVIAAFATIGAHYLYTRRGTEGWKLRALRTFLSLLAQFVTGGLISSFLIFYTRDAALVASWPFLALLVIIFVGNEFFRHYREALSFRSILFFFTLYIYVLFALPYLLHTLGGNMFLESTGIALSIFALYLLGLRLAGKERFWDSMKTTIPAVLLMAIFFVTSYYTGVIPPLPVALRDAGVYHSVVHTGDTYTLSGEDSTTPWWDIIGITPVTVHLTPGAPASVYAAVFAPTRFATSVEHLWQRKEGHRWVSVADVSFPISGGRDGGYRGYSTVSSLTPGNYRVTIRTGTKQVIGRLYFIVVSASSTPPLTTQTD